MNKEALDILGALTLGRKSAEVAKYTHFIIYDPITRPRFIVPVLTNTVNDFRKLYMKDGVVYISEEITGNPIDLTLWDIENYQTMLSNMVKDQKHGVCVITCLVL